MVFRDMNLGKPSIKRKNRSQYVVHLSLYVLLKAFLTATCSGRRTSEIYVRNLMNKKIDSKEKPLSDRP